MKLEKIGLIVLCLFISFVSCKKDDDGDTIVFEENDRTEQQVIDNDSILGYLETHYYNKTFKHGVDLLNANMQSLFKDNRG